MFPQPSLPPALELVRRTIAAETAYAVSRLQVVERNPGNPFGVAFHPFGDGGMALMARRIPLPLFNSVKGMGPGDETQIAEISTWYRENGVNGQFELIPGLFDEALARELHKAGYFHSGFHVALVAESEAAVPVLPPGVELSRSTIPHSSMTSLMRMSPVGDLNAGIAEPLKLMCENGLGGRAGRFISPASMAGQRQPQRCSCTKRRATARMPRPIRFFAVAVCIERCWRSGLPMPLSPALILCAVVLIFFLQAIATWSGPACGCNSSERYGRK